jgi:hypothetical protein
MTAGDAGTNGQRGRLLSAAVVLTGWGGYMRPIG